MRLRRLPCGEPLAFRSEPGKRRGFASGGLAAKTNRRLDGKPEAFRTGGGKAAEPKTQNQRHATKDTAPLTESSTAKKSLQHEMRRQVDQYWQS